MTEREKLKQLLINTPNCDNECSLCEYNYTDDKCEEHLSGIMADHLLANGVIVPPCKVGNKVYVFVNWCDYTNCHFEGCAGCSKCNDKGIVERKFNYSMLEDFGKTVFLTREDAEKALKECEENDL